MNHNQICGQQVVTNTILVGVMKPNFHPLIYSEGAYFPDFDYCKFFLSKQWNFSSDSWDFVHDGSLVCWVSPYQQGGSC
jgi:hypothetical protein